jgi:phage-related baseplate assembly protein
MTRFVAIDLAGMNPPDVVERLDYEAILVALKADLVARLAAVGIAYNVQDLESDPAVKVLEVADYRELITRGRINDAARAVMLAYAHKSDLDHLGVYYGVARRVVTPADGDTPAVFELDESLRARIQLAPEAFSSAGAEGAYQFHTLTVDTSVKDVAVLTQEGSGHVHVIPLTSTGNGVPANTLLERIRGRLLERKIKPLTDIITVRAPAVTNYTVQATLEIGAGPDPTVVRAAAQASALLYIAARHRVGFPVRRNGVIAALGVAGVENITLASPAADIVPAEDGVAFATAVTVQAA